MIVDTFYAGLDVVVRWVLGWFPTWKVDFPSAADAAAKIKGWLGSVSGFIDGGSMGVALQIVPAALGAALTVRGALWLYAHIPWFGKGE